MSTSTTIKTDQTSETNPAYQRAGSPGRHVAYSETLNPSNSRTNSLAPSSIALQGERTRSNTTTDQRAGSPGQHMPYNRTLHASRPNNSASSVTAPAVERPRSASTTSTSALHFSSSQVRKNSTASTNDTDFEKFVSYPETKPSSSSVSTSSSSSAFKTPSQAFDTDGKPFATYKTNKPAHLAATASVSAFKPTNTASHGLPDSPYQQWTRLNPNPNKLPAASKVENQSISPLKQAKAKIISNDHQDGISTPPHPLQFMSLQSPAKPPMAPRAVDRSPSPARAEDNVSGRMSRGFNNPSPTTPLSSPSPTTVSSESGLLSPTSPSSGMLSSSASEIFSSTPSSTLTSSASSVSPTSHSTSPSSASSTPSPHEAVKKGYVSYQESKLSKPTRQLTEQETIERSEKVISGLSFGASRVVRKAPPKSHSDASSSSASSTASSEKPVSLHQVAATAPYVQWNNVAHAPNSALIQETTNPNKK